MEQQLMTDIEQNMLGCLDNAQMEQLHHVLLHCFYGVEVRLKEGTMIEAKTTNEELLTLFLSAKKVEGCSDKTLHYGIVK